MERDAHAMALRIIAEEERDGWSRPLTSDADDAFQRRFGALGVDEATERLTEEEALQAKILMRDLPRVLAALEATGVRESRGEPESSSVAAAQTKEEEPVLSPPSPNDAVRVEDENSVDGDGTVSGVSKNQSRSETTTMMTTGEDVDVWHPGKGTALERVCALEAELRMILGEDIVNSALDGELKSSVGGDGLSAGGSGAQDETSRDDVERFGAANAASAVAEAMETPTPRKKLVLMPTPIGKGDESPDLPGCQPAAAPVAKDTAAANQVWDPYSAFIGVAKERHFSPRTEPLTSNPISPPKASGGMNVDFSLTHDETMRLVADLEQKVKSSPKVKSPRPSLSEYKNDVVIEDVAEDEENDEQKYTHQYTKADANSILELAEPERGGESTGLWRARDEEDVTPRPPSTVKPSPRDAGDGVQDVTESAYEPKIAGVESLAEFKMMMDSVFDDA